MPMTDAQRAWLLGLTGLGPKPAGSAAGGSYIPGVGAITAPVPVGPPARLVPQPGTKKGPQTLPAPMLPDCKIVIGKVPGPVNHVLCGTHGHVVDTASKMIIAHSIDEYKAGAPVDAPGHDDTQPQEPVAGPPGGEGEPSGAAWVKQFPTSRSVSDLKGSFADSATKFLAALAKAGADVSISATFRPPERAYLMHWSYLIAKKGQDPAKVPSMAGVAIDWEHKDGSGKPDLAAAKKAAQEMVDAYDIVYEPALGSRHTEGLAIDMTISWSGTLSIDGADGKRVDIASSPADGGNSALHSVGAGYGVVKLKSDPPHWSSDGH